MSENVNFEKIWAVVQQIPVGRVATYGQVADLAGLPKRARLVGKALKLSPPGGFNGQVIPWFRVLRASGQIAFPVASEAFEDQRAALIAEGIAVKGRSVSLKYYLWQPELFELLYHLDN